MGLRVAKELISCLYWAGYNHTWLQNLTFIALAGVIRTHCDPLSNVIQYPFSLGSHRRDDALWFIKFETYDYPEIYWDTCLTYNVAIGSRSSKVRVQARYNTMMKIYQNLLKENGKRWSKTKLINTFMQDLINNKKSLIKRQGDR